MAASEAASVPAPATDRLARLAERLLRVAGDARTGVALLALTGALNVVAAFRGSSLLDSPLYALLLGMLGLSGVAGVAVRVPAAWREWRRPGPVQHGRGAQVVRVGLTGASEVATALERLGWRVRLEQGRGRWAIHAVRRGWARFAGIGSHVAVVVIILGVAIGSAFGSETVASLLTGDQALLDIPRPGFSSAVRLDGLDASFDADGRPLRLDTRITFLRDGQPVQAAVVRVNEPGSFDGYLVHAWTYGPAARLRVTTLAGTALLDAPVPLDATSANGAPAGAAELPTLGLTLGLALADADANELGVSLLGGSGLVDAVRLRPGDEVRLGDVRVALSGFDAWVTLVSRRDPGMGVVLGGAALLCASLAVAFWWPRRRLSIRPRGEALEVVMRGERFDRATGEMERIVAALGTGR